MYERKRTGEPLLGWYYLADFMDEFIRQFLPLARSMNIRSYNGYRFGFLAMALSSHNLSYTYSFKYMIWLLWSSVSGAG